MRTLPWIAVLAGCGGGLRALPDESGDGRPGSETELETGFDPNPNGNGNGNGDDNAAPVADAGLDATAQVGSVVVVDGSASHDPDGDNLAYLWEFLSAPPTSTTYLVNDARVDASFYADAEGSYTVRLTVDDGLSSAVDDVDVSVTAPNGSPIAAAGADQSVTTGTTVQLDGSTSWDPDGDALNFTWSLVSKPAGSGASLSTETSALPTFVADAAGRYEISLVVDDGASVSSADLVAVTAETPSSGDDSLCFAPAAARLAAGRSASAPAMLLLPALTLLVLRRRERG